MGPTLTRRHEENSAGAEARVEFAPCAARSAAAVHALTPCPSEFVPNQVIPHPEEHVAA